MKQVIIIPAWLNMTPGKVASQAAHVAARAKNGVSKQEGVRVILRADTPEQLLDVLGKAYARSEHMDITIFADSAATTQNTENKITAVAITTYGFDGLLGQITSGLELY